MDVTEVVLAIVAILLAAAVLALVLLRRSGAGTPARFEALERGLERLERLLRDESARGREDAAGAAKSLREEVQGAIAAAAAAQAERLEDIRSAVARELAHSRTEGASATAAQSERLDQVRNAVAHELAQTRTEAAAATAAASAAQAAQLQEVRATLDHRLQALQEDNARKLDQIRRTVDEQLQGTLEKRLGESFRLVSERLEQVHAGLGDMQRLAAGVGDLKKVLTDVRARGAWGEVQLGALLEQILAPDQFARNVATGGTLERVEFAVRMPGPDRDPVWLPIDAKFPVEDYLRIVDAAERGEAGEVEAGGRQLEARIRQCARDISHKYLHPPHTTEFALMYLPTESLYAEALRRPGLVESLQQDYKVAVAGPTTLAALLNSLQMGFRTLAIQKRSSEVWELLGEVKAEFGKYADVLAAVQKKLQEASNKVDFGLQRTRAIERKLRQVQELPAGSQPLLIEEPGDEETEAVSA